VTAPPSGPEWLVECSGTHIAVLGADGFIGSHVVRLALGAGAAVTALCSKRPWRLAGFEQARLEAVPLPNWWTESSASALRSRLAGADALALLAYSPPRGTDPAARDAHEHEVNAAGARRAAEIAAAEGATVVFASSADVYGSWWDSPVSELAEPTPTTPYSRAKVAAEKMVAAACARRVPSVSLRISTVHGPGETGPRAIPSFVRCLLAGEPARIEGSGLDVRDYVNVVDVAAAFANACVQPPSEAVGGVLNVSSGKGRTTLEVLETVATVLGVEPRRRHVPARRPPSRLVVDPRKARSLLGMQPRADWVAEVASEVDWLRAWLDRQPGFQGSQSEARP
jgi:nucleoside-diphosphate-sugar epimerase